MNEKILHDLLKRKFILVPLLLWILIGFQSAPTIASQELLVPFQTGNKINDGKSERNGCPNLTPNEAVNSNLPHSPNRAVNSTLNRAMNDAMNGGSFLLEASTDSGNERSQSAANALEKAASEKPFVIPGLPTKNNGAGKKLFLKKNEFAEKKEDASHPNRAWIFVPVDQNGRPVGNDYYLPVETFQKIYQKPFGQTARKEEPYFFRRATYSGAFSSMLTSSDVVLDSIRAVYEIETILPKTKMRFPFSSNQVYVAPGYSRMNGESVQVFWENGFPVVEIPKAGRYLLEFTLIPIVSHLETTVAKNSSSADLLSQGFASDEPSVSPAVSPSGDSSAINRNETGRKNNAEKSPGSESVSGHSPVESMNGFKFSIPRIPNSQLKLRTPSGILKQIDFPSAYGSREFDQSERSWNVQLGSATTLSAQWKAPGLAPQGSTLLADELYSWQINKNGRSLQCRHRFQPGESKIASLEWSMDSRFQLDPTKIKIFVWHKLDALSEAESFSDVGSRFRLAPFAGKKHVQIRTEGDKQHLTIAFFPPISETVLTDFSIAISDRESIGSYPIPFIRSEKTKAARRWFQIVSESEYQLSLPEIPTIPQVSQPEFQAVWDEFSPFPQSDALPSAFISTLTLDDTQGLSQTQLWRIQAQPLPKISMVQESLSCAFTSNFVQIHYVVHLPSENAVPALFHLQVPEGLKVEKIVCKNQFSTKNLSFFQNAPTRLGIFHEKAPSDQKQNPTINPNGSWLQRLTDASNDEKNAENAINFQNLSMENGILPENNSGNENPAPDEINVLANRENQMDSTANATPSTECRIELSGRIEVPASETMETKIPFPEIRLSSSEILSAIQKINLFRTADVLITGEIFGVTLDQKNDGLNLATQIPGKFKNARPVASFSISPREKNSGFILIQPNRPKINMTCRTLLKMPRTSNSGSAFNLENQDDFNQESFNQDDFDSTPTLSAREETSVDQDRRFNAQKDETASQAHPEAAPQERPDENQVQNQVQNLDEIHDVNQPENHDVNQVENREANIPENRDENIEHFNATTSEALADSGAAPQLNRDELWSQTFHAPGNFWQVSVEMILNVENGLADELTIEIPGEVLAPFELDPPTPFSLETIPQNEIAEKEKFQNTDSESKNGNSLPQSEVVPQKNSEYGWTRMVVRPATPFSGVVKLRLTGRLRDEQIKTSARSGPTHLPNIRFPGINVQNHDVILPVFSSPNEKNAYLWAVEGMLPIRSSSLEPSQSFSTNPRNKAEEKPAPQSSNQSSNQNANQNANQSSNQNAPLNASQTSTQDAQTSPLPNESAQVASVPETQESFLRKAKNQPKFHQWSEGPTLQIFRIVESRYSAQLQVQNLNLLNPVLETVNHSVYLNDARTLLGISTLDVMPQNASVCILRVPENIELLELHLDFMPVQAEEIFWNASLKEFQPAENVVATESPRPRFFKIALRSLLLPQRLEVLFCGKLPSSKRKDFRPFDLELPELIQRSASSFVPAKGKNGAVFFYSENATIKNLWKKSNEPQLDGNRKTTSENRKAPDSPKSAESSRKKKTGTQNSQKTAKTETNPLPNPKDSFADRNSVQNSNRNLTSNSAPISGQNSGPNSNQNSAQASNLNLPLNSNRTQGATASGARKTEKIEELQERPWIRVQLLTLERILGVARQVSVFQNSGAMAKDEKKSWFENWDFLRLGYERILLLSMNFRNEPTQSEMRQDFERLRDEGNRIFGAMQDKTPQTSAQISPQFPTQNMSQTMTQTINQTTTQSARGLNDLKKASLWIVFIQNIPLEKLNCQAFDSEGISDFRILAASDQTSWKPKFSGEALYTLFFTAMILMGLHFHPSIPEEVRTAPFWLLSCGSLWLICGLNFWIGFALLVASAILLTFRIINMSWLP